MAENTVMVPVVIGAGDKNTSSFTINNDFNFLSNQIEQ